jgi:hypothetical protein
MTNQELEALYWAEMEQDLKDPEVYRSFYGAKEVHVHALAKGNKMEYKILDKYAADIIYSLKVTYELEVKGHHCEVECNVATDYDFQVCDQDLVNWRVLPSISYSIWADEDFAKLEEYLVDETYKTLNEKVRGKDDDK